jgi:hypothetical protein
VTVTLIVAVKAPSTVVTVIVATPTLDFAVTTPETTVATDEFDVDQIKDLLVALVGSTRATRLRLALNAKSIDLVLTIKPVTGCKTVTDKIANLPLIEVALIFATPGPTAVTTPVELTFTTCEFEEAHLSVLSVAF